ncbi:Fic family protein [Candidatus Daviesbacteria bacterium]|nr:Fic family protein [Candidatus Daviesbacteria bacterium]
MDNKLKKLTEKKQKLDSLKPLPEEATVNLEEWLKIELTYSSNAIEGNTLSRIETAEVIEKGISATISGKPLKDQLEAINHARAIEFIKELAKQRKSHQFITKNDILAIHKIILDGIMDDFAGKYRQTQVFLRGADFDLPTPQQVPNLMQRFVGWLNDQQEGHPVRIASIAHYKFEGIHPFIDGNGRVGRLLMNLILIINGYPMAIIKNEHRTEYLNAFKIGQSTKDWRLLLNLVEDAVERSLDAYINAAEGKAVLPGLMGEVAQTEIEKLYKIGEFAKTAGETIPTIRYWTNEGLLKIAKLTKGGYALYDSSQIDKAKEVRYLQNEQRLTIAEIKEKLGIRG